MPGDDAASDVLGPRELADLAIARYGVNWVSRLARDMGVSTAAVSRWKKAGIAKANRAMQVRALLIGGATRQAGSGAASASPPSPAEFDAWFRKNFRSNNHAANTLGLDRDALRAMRSGTTRNGNAYEIRPWVRYMMAGYNLRSHGELSTAGRGKLDMGKAAELLGQGMSGYAVANAFDVSKNTIRWHQRKGRLPIVDRTLLRGSSKVDIDRALELLAQGLTTREVAKDLGVHAQTIWRHQREGNLPRAVSTVRRGQKRRSTPRNTAFKMRLGEAQQLLSAGASVADVAAKIGVSRMSIYNALNAGKLTRPAGNSE